MAREGHLRVRISRETLESHTRGLKVLIAEPHRTVAESLIRLVTAYGNAEIAGQADSAEKALELAKKLAPDVAIVDLDLSPHSSLVSGLHGICPETRIIVLADRTRDDGSQLVEALGSGAVAAMYQEASFQDLERALSQSSASTPVVADEAAGVLLNSYLEAMTEKRVRDLATIEALASALKARDLATGRHVSRVTDLAASCMSKIDCDLAKNEEVAFGFMLHDVGKIGVPDAILNKPGPLANDEWQVMRRHPEMGVDIVKPIGFSETATEIILHHHEHFDGKGYPHGLKGDQIPLTARAFAVADAYDAMTTDRPYRAAMPPGEALQVIEDQSGRIFDPAVTTVFAELTEVCPT